MCSWCKNVKPVRPGGYTMACAHTRPTWSGSEFPCQETADLVPGWSPQEIWEDDSKWDLGPDLGGIVTAAAARFDARPLYRASVEARAELKTHSCGSPTCSYEPGGRWDCENPYRGWVWE